MSIEQSLYQLRREARTRTDQRHANGERTEPNRPCVPGRGWFRAHARCVQRRHTVRRDRERRRFEAPRTFVPAGRDQLVVVGSRAASRSRAGPPPLRYIRRRFTPAAVILLHAVRYRRGTAARRKAQAPNGTYATPGPCGTPTSAAHAWIALSCCSRECKCTEYKPRTGRRSPRPWGLWGLAQVALTLGTCHPSPCRHSPHRV